MRNKTTMFTGTIRIAGLFVLAVLSGCVKEMDAQDISSGKLSENATDSDISAALDQLFSLKDELSKSLPVAAESPQPGTLVSIKV